MYLLSGEPAQRPDFLRTDRLPAAPAQRQSKVLMGDIKHFYPSGREPVRRFPPVGVSLSKIGLMFLKERF
jgi:hypothetical protein